MHARTILRLDAIFECLLGAVLVVAWPLGWFELAGWEGWPAAAVGLALMIEGIVLWRAAATASMLRLLAVANAAGAVLFAVWLLLWWEDFDAVGVLLAAGTAAVLTALAVTEGAVA